jgi:hypothetical protein
MAKQKHEQPPMIERVERALLVLAYLMERDGDVHLELYESLERDLDQLRKSEDTRQRARRRLQSYTRSGDVKAICSRNLSLSSSDGPLPYLGL